MGGGGVDGGGCDGGHSGAGTEASIVNEKAECWDIGVYTTWQVLVPVKVMNKHAGHEAAVWSAEVRRLARGAVGRWRGAQTAKFA